jgi:gamma-glutamyl:cysteine ligase YbdK (ATP-grasp superfamily)
VEDARAELADALDEIELRIVDAVEAVAAGESMVELVARTQLRARRRLADALKTMTSALAENRVAAIRVVIDDEQLSITEAARLFGIPRQVLSRLYHRSA